MACVWTKRDRLCFPNLAAGAQYSLPLFLHAEEANHIFVTDMEGWSPQCCEDTVYEALDNRLFWLNYTAPITGVVEIQVYHTLAPAKLGDYDASSGMMNPAMVQPGSPEHSLAFADFFNLGRPGVMGRWRADVDVELAKNCIDVSSCVERGIPAAPCRSHGNVLVLDTQVGRIALCRTLISKTSIELGRLHARCFFFDTYDSHSSSNNWLAAATVFGSGAVGLATSAGSSFQGYYAYIHGSAPVGAKGETLVWQASAVPRTKGWHIFELCWEDQQLCISIDGEPVSMAAAEGFHSKQDVRLVSAGIGGANGIWAAVETFHTPLGRGGCDLSVQSVKPGVWSPWQRTNQEAGRWLHDGRRIIQQPVKFVSHVKFATGLRARIVPDREQLLTAFNQVAFAFPPNALGKGRFHPGMVDMLGKVYDVVEVLDNGFVGLPAPSNDEVWLFPPAILEMIEDEPELPVEVPEGPVEIIPQDVLLPEPFVEEVEEVPMEVRPIQEAPPEPPSQEPGFAIECWMLPRETDRQRVERAMAHVVEQLLASGVVLPEKIQLVDHCREKQHAGCFVYRFGTRRLHVATRAIEGGRLLIVVRCGGGFVDFADFARRHGSLENIKMKRQAGSGGNGKEVMHFTSVLSRGQAVLHESARLHIPSPNATEP